MKQRSVVLAALALSGCATTQERIRSPEQACAIFAVTETNHTEGRYYTRREADGSTTYAIGDQISQGGIETSEVNLARDGTLTVASRFHVSANAPSAQRLGITQDFVVSAERVFGRDAMPRMTPAQDMPGRTPYAALVNNARVLTAMKVGMLTQTLNACLLRARANPELLRPENRYN